MPSKWHMLKNNGKDPPLSEEGKQLVRGAMDDAIRMLADRQINMSGMSPSTPEDEIPPKLRENKENVKNRAREVKFSADIAQANAEEEAWCEATEFYKAHQAAVVADIECSQKLPLGSAKAKGKHHQEG
ncbi:hypothetical protein EWM64_g9005 [Hericium alpestre]|uniref:Uncharacterized protein n=1 Tax=Hericium alpestre TaxID=135208 RepID=A0A4Y9ZLN9_9AGAM|nr:hypothetical protein EWM64_g9005 [Hericium alpestre]